MPNAVSIGTSCFMVCPELRIVNMNSIQSIAEDAFYDCYITDLNISNCTRLGFRAFHGATIDCELSLLHLKTTGDAVFEEASIKSLHAPNWKTAGSDTFRKTANITEISLQSLETVGDYFIFECANLTSISLPNLTKIGSYGFCGMYMPRLELPKLQSCGSYLFFRSNIREHILKSLIRVGDSGLAESFIERFNLPFVQEIGFHCFNNSATLIEVSLEKLQYLSAGAFYNCTKLQNVVLPAVTTIDAVSFYECRSLRSVSFPYVISLYRNVFQNCTGIETVLLPSVRSILGDYHFQGCVKLSYIDIRGVERVASDGNHIFEHCSSLKRIFLPSNVPSTFADDVFRRTGRPLKKNGAIDIIVCLESESDYNTYQRESDSKHWKGLDVTVPKNHGETCLEQTDLHYVAAICCATLVGVGIIVAGVIVWYHRRRMRVIDEDTRRIELGKTILDDFG